jgi:hypothetical protein
VSAGSDAALLPAFFRSNPQAIVILSFWLGPLFSILAYQRDDRKADGNEKLRSRNRG